MTQFIRLTAVLAFVAAMAAGALALTYGATKDKIARQERAAKAEALTGIFFRSALTLCTPEERAQGKGNAIALVEGGDETLSVYAIYADPADAEPAYYAAEGEGVGYNAGVPIRLLVGFTNPARDPAPLLAGYVPETALPTGGAGAAYIVGWKVVKSEETPGLGEKAKDSKPPYTWSEGGPFSGKEPEADTRTPFQAQFAGKKAPELKLKPDGGDLDGITASTYTSRGIVKAIRSASQALGQALEPKPETPSATGN